MSDEEALFAAILAHPDEDTPRLVYADWLQEHGDEPRADFIRLQIERERLTPADPQFPTVLRRERTLFAHHKARWLMPLQVMLPGASMKFRRGFVEELTVPAALFARHGDEVAKMAPLRMVRVTQLGVHAADVSRVPCGPGARVYGVIREARWSYPEERVEFLRQASDALEPYIAVGRWLVLAWAVWSGPDRRAVQEAIAFADRYYPLPAGECNVAIRPFDAEDEFRTWCPVEVPSASPHWLLLDAGRLVEDRIGNEPPERWRDFLTGGEP
jgi:uncharacterized protein (TIGR02996 family)